MLAAQETVCMFTFLGRLATQHPWCVLVSWLVLGVGLMSVAPRWEQNAQDDDIKFLPGRCDSVKGYRLLEQAFPNDVYASRVIFALERDNSRPTPRDLTPANEIAADLTRPSER